MSDKIQALNTIAPMGQTEQSSSKISDPVQSEYEEGKKALEDGFYGQAAVSLHNSLIGFEQRDDESGIANACNQLGHLCLTKEDYDKSLKYYQRAFEICDKNNDRSSVLAVLKQMVEVYCGRGDNKKGINVCLEMLDLYHDNRDVGGTVKVLERMVEIYLAGEQKDKAVDTYRTISSIHKNFSHDKLAASFAALADKLEAE